MKQRNILIATLLILAVAAFRIANAAEWHFSNFAPVAAIGLFAGAIIKDKRMAYLLPMLSLLFSDLYFALFTHTPGFYGISQFFVYGAMVLVTYLGTRLRQPNAFRVAGFAISGTLIFFLLSNFGVWVEQVFATAPMKGYTANLSGLMYTYIAGIPFYKGTLLGDLIFSGILFGSYALLGQPKQKLVAA